MLKNFEELIFEVEVKPTKTAKFIVLENFPLYGITKTYFHTKSRFLQKFYVTKFGDIQ